MRFIILSLFFAVILSGCAENTPVLIDCGNGYQVRPPLSCPEIGAKF
jgi:hypothetical protein